jgi:hypothetical protein
MATGKAGNHKQSSVFRRLHKDIKKWAKENGHEWEVLSTKNGWKYKLDGKRITSSHKANHLTNDFKSALRRAGIPREVIGIVMPGSFSGYELPDGITPHWTHNLSANLRDAKVGELIWVRGHDVLVVGRIEQPDITKRCPYCDGKGEVEFYEYDEPEHWEECECVGIAVIVQFLPNGMKQRYEHHFPPYE